MTVVKAVVGNQVVFWIERSYEFTPYLLLIHYSKIIYFMYLYFSVLWICLSELCVELPITLLWNFHEYWHIIFKPSSVSLPPAEENCVLYCPS